MSLTRISLLLIAALCAPAMANPNASADQSAPYDAMGTPAQMQQKRSMSSREDRPVIAAKGGGVVIQDSPEQNKSGKPDAGPKLRFNAPKP